LIASADMVRGFLKLRETPMGFDPQNLATLTVSLPGAVYGVKQFSPEQSVTLTMDRIAEEVAALPGVTGVAYTSTPPRSESDPRAQFTVPGREMVQAGDAPVASWRAVSANYFSVMRIPVSGRSFTAQDTFGKEPVIIVSASLAKRLFGGEDPLGKQILFF